jgi:hypothetical protein
MGSNYFSAKGDLLLRTNFVAGARSTCRSSQQGQLRVRRIVAVTSLRWVAILALSLYMMFLCLRASATFQTRSAVAYLILRNPHTAAGAKPGHERILRRVHEGLAAGSAGAGPGEEIVLFFAQHAGYSSNSDTPVTHSRARMSCVLNVART